MSKLSEDVMRGMGVSVADAAIVTQSRWDATRDGVHYATNDGKDNWYGQVTYMVYEVIMNTIFPDCHPAPDTAGT